MNPPSFTGRPRILPICEVVELMGGRGKGGSLVFLQENVGITGSVLVIEPVGWIRDGTRFVTNKIQGCAAGKKTRKINNPGDLHIF